MIRRDAEGEEEQQQEEEQEEEEDEGMNKRCTPSIELDFYYSSTV